MIVIRKYSDCCGCTACLSICPQHCITMKEDKEGFLYPVVNQLQCIDCNLCQKVCPIQNQHKERTPLVVYAAKNKNEQIRLKSSSGGIFTLLAENVIEKGGVVFGARFDENWDVIHDCTETKEGLVAFRGSKYVQSRIGDCYLKVKRFLSEGRIVMFTGTPCQVSGLKKFLGKDYDNLLTVDVVCHGVPSPKVWRMYLKEIFAREGKKNSVLLHPIHERNAHVRGISFRDKSLGWKKYSFALILSKATAVGEQNTVLLSSIFNENPFMKAFLFNLSLRPSCYACPAKSGKSESDVTIADFWGIEDVLPEFDDDKGVSLVMLMNQKGERWFNSLSTLSVEVTYNDAWKANHCINQSVQKSPYRDFFFHQLNQKKDFLRALDDCTSPLLGKRIFRFLVSRFNRE